MKTHTLEPFLDLLKLLIREPSVVGAEVPFFRILQRELESRGATVHRYEGVLVAEGPRPESLMISAHVDRHGLISTGPGELQYAAFIAKNHSDLFGDSISEQTYLNMIDRFCNMPVQAYDPWHGGYIGQATISSVSMNERINNLTFELDGLHNLPPGSPVAYLDRLETVDGWIQGQLDNVLTVAMLVYLFELGFEGRAFFTAEEEAGRSWRYLYDWFRRYQYTTDKLLVIDTSPFSDRDLVMEQDIVLRHEDANAKFSQSAEEWVWQSCEALSLRYRFKDDWIRSQNPRREQDGLKPLSLGRTELGRMIVASNGAVSGTTLQVPTTGYHTCQETASLVSVEAMIMLLEKLVRTTETPGYS